MGASTSAPEWQSLRAAVMADRQLRDEIEWLLRLSVESYNPSSRGVRFITGSIGEWLLAFAAYSAGVLALPDGHDANGHDLRALAEASRGLWSVKSSYSRGGSFGVSNGRNGPGPGMTGPTVFWSPEFPGMVYVDPELHSHVKSAEIAKSDQMQLPKTAVQAHAIAHPDCVIELTIPDNPGTATRDPGFEAVKILVESGPFVRLRRMLEAAAPNDASIVAQLTALRAMRDAGDLTQEAYEAAVQKVVG